ncbi:MAG: nuclear transport factor 2 family protein [Betaproteobacteria bacterium]|nr:nuclear transport factor 2 family protein [Betaproteobacteria bacterium]
MATRQSSKARGRSAGTARAKTGETGSLSAGERRALRRLLDEAAIRSVIDDYFHCVDSRTLNGLGRVFTEDVRYDFSGGLVRYDGWKGTARGLENTLRGGSISSSNHFASSVRIRVRGDTAVSDTHAVVFLMSERSNGGAGTVISRGLRYKDEWVRTPRGWRIAYRLHARTWTAETLAVPPAAPPGKRMRPGVR